MKKLFYGVMFAFVFLVPVAGVQAQSSTAANTGPSAAAFTGAWVLDKQKSSAKDYPVKLQNYRMLVAESENLLNVKNQIEGKVEVEISKDRAPEVGSSTPGLVAGATGRGASGGSAGTAKTSYNGSLALVVFTPKEVTYKLTGGEEKVEIKQGEKVTGVARIRAKLDKSGKTLQITTFRRMKTAQGEVETTVWETWKLSGDGKSLKFTRTVEMPTVRDELSMMLTRPAQQ